MYKIIFQNIRDILLVVGIYLFFSGWVYVYYFYEYFGLSISGVKIDYTSYLVYSFVVLTSFYYLPLILLVSLILIYYYWLKKSLLILIIITLLVFPALYLLSRTVAVKDAENIRRDTNVKREIEFVFRDESGLLSNESADSLASKNSLTKYDLPSIKYPGKNQMHLLGENDNYFFVLNQPPVSKNTKVLSIGSVYFIDKKDVLLTKITIR